MRNYTCVVIIILGFLLGGCASRKITIKSEPPGAKVIMDGQEKGITPCSFHFTYYGSRQIALEKDGYQTFKVIASVNPPWVHAFPFDVLLLFIPYPMTDHHKFSYQLVPVSHEEQDMKAAVRRGEELKEYLNKQLERK